ncbi:methyl-accepting chemotaxis protein [Geomesophilobacter sediminis]|uniref:Methyl-accepting chemotaxis protein n=1 Tax=Geomesophilobacter sediminis TaxID=2798584 RepID=A0A8J7IZ04_9BACT|nr:methyl-accepting chemotaxis protein [Geomesophilobacter sediminis]MBJ6725417.1 methyl-accepting chemotaxis protein [Geomesophilobacter sediminis]
MEFKLFRHWRIQNKIMFITVLSVTIMLLGMFLFLLPMLEKWIINEKRDATRHVVELAMGILEQQDAEVRAGHMSLETAQKEAQDHISKLRYEKKEYIWINDLKSICIMHPIKPELNGKDLSEMKDPNGVRIFSEFVKVCKEKGDGFVNYMWPRPGEKEPIPKLSYVKAFQPWGWVLGSGIYIDDVNRELSHVKWLFLALNAFVACFSFILAFSVSRGITRTLGRVDRTLAEMASGKGDLTRRLEVEREDETGSLARSFNRFLDNLKEIVVHISNNSVEVASAAKKLNDTAANIASGTEKVALESGSVAIASEEMAATSSAISQNCAAAVTNVTRAGETAKEGAVVVGKAVQSIQRIADKVSESAQTVASLGSRSDQIGEIIGTIEDIADQTNLLALNAAIEAARAGEQGRGFAVVADEVRALAERTTTATRQISEMIQTIQRETASAVTAMEEGVREVNMGTEDAASSGRALEDILNQVCSVTGQIDQISVSAQEQTSATNDISSNMRRITEEVERTSTNAQATATSAGQLAEMAEELKRIVAQFRL